MDEKPKAPLRILLVDDDEDEYILTRDLLTDQSFLSSGAMASGLVLEWVASYEEAVTAFRTKGHDLYLLDYNLGGKTGLDLLRAGQDLGVRAPFILMTGQGSYALDVEAMALGAADYLPKAELNAVLLERAIRYALERKRAETSIRQNAARAELRASFSQAFVEAGLDFLRTLDTITRWVTAPPGSPAAEAKAASPPVPAPPNGGAGLGEACALFLLSEDRQRLELASLHHIDPVAGESVGAALAAAPASIDSGWGWQVYSRNAPQCLASPAAGEPDIPASGGLPAQLDPCGAIIFPLRSHQRFIGALGVFRFGSGREFSAEDQAFLQDLSNLAALALENVLLHTEVQKLAVTDSLTDLYNRRGFFDLGRREIERTHRFGRPLSLLMIDLDDFKVVNDTFGHPAGDYILQVLAGRLRVSIRETDIPARFGGDEFVILLPETGPEVAVILAERIRQLVAEPIDLPEELDLLAADAGRRAHPASLHLSASLGMAAAEAAHDLQTLIDAADAAVYTAKRSGRNRVANAIYAAAEDKKDAPG